MKSIFLWIYDVASSLKLTIVCLAAAMVLVFAGTMAQVEMGLHEVQARYFQSWIMWWQPSGLGGLRIPIFPGGHLIGAVMLVNMIFAPIRRYPKYFRSLSAGLPRILIVAGLSLTHLGIIVILAGGLLTDLFSVESRMAIREGETTNYSEDLLRMELAVIDTTDPQSEQVTAIPAERLQTGAVIEHSSLPFQIKVVRYFRNSHLAALGEGDEPAATHGIGARAAVTEIPHATAMNERDMPSAVVELLPAAAPGGETSEASAGTWLVSSLLGQPQSFPMAGRRWTIALRPVRYYKPYSITLLDFTHERYPGTGIPKNFSSKIRLVDPERSVDREVLIYMNHPLRYRGETYYQASFGANDTLSILQVVRNPSVLAPYVGCVITGIGMLLLFGVYLWKFARRQAKTPKSETQ